MAITSLTHEELRHLLDQQTDIQVIDVRTPEEYLYLGHLPQACPIPLHELPYRFRELDTHKATVVLCQHGVRSMDACYFLQAQGFSNVYNLEEGLADWTGPLERDISGLEAMANKSFTE